MKEQCNICGKDFELIDLTCLCDECFTENSNDIVAVTKQESIQCTKVNILNEVRKRIADDLTKLKHGGMEHKTSGHIRCLKIIDEFKNTEVTIPMLK